MPGNTRTTVILWRGPQGGGALSIPAAFPLEEAAELVGRIADAMRPDLLAETRWVAQPNTSLRFAQWPG